MVLIYSISTLTNVQCPDTGHEIPHIPCLRLQIRGRPVVVVSVGVERYMLPIYMSWVRLDLEIFF